MINVEYKYSRITAKIIRSAMTVHTALGTGFQELIYQRALEIEMHLMNLTFSREVEMPVFYREQQVGLRRVDFLVEGIICVELKAKTKLEDIHFAETMNYLEVYNV
ncbi:MAG: GxxExxY protein [Ferruginibacter sp.]